MPTFKADLKYVMFNQVWWEKNTIDYLDDIEEVNTQVTGAKNSAVGQQTAAQNLLVEATNGESTASTAKDNCQTYQVQSEDALAATDNVYSQITPYKVTSKSYEFTAGAGQTVLVGEDDHGTTLFLQVYSVLVWINDKITTEYVVDSDAQITLNSPLNLGDKVVVSTTFKLLPQTFTENIFLTEQVVTEGGNQKLYNVGSSESALVQASSSVSVGATGYVKFYWTYVGAVANYAYYVDPNTGDLQEIVRPTPPNPDQFLVGNYFELSEDYSHVFITNTRLTSEDMAAVDSNRDILWDVLYNAASLPSGWSISDCYFYYPADEGPAAEERMYNILMSSEDQKIVFYIGPGQGNNSMYINAALGGEYYLDGALRVSTGLYRATFNPNSRHEIYDPNHVITSISGIRWYGYCPDFTGSYNLESVDIQGFSNGSLIGNYPNVDGCTSLTYLDLRRNHFDGGLDSILDRDSLVYLNISENRSSTGTFRIDGLPNLETLTVAYTNWYQQFPDMDTHGALKYVNAYRSYFNGTPPKLSPQMEYCKFDNTKLVGQLPDMNDSIQEFYASNISGITAIGSFLGAINLKAYRAYSCSVSSTFPSQSELNSCVLLEDFQLQRNRITGTHPVALSLPNLDWYDISSNDTMSQSAMTDFTGCNSLRVLNLSNTNVSGGISDLSFMSLLAYVYLRSPYITGDIFDFTNHPNLYYVDLYGNSGMTPTAFPDITNTPALHDLVLREVPFAGASISQLNTAIALYQLNIQGCDIGGDLPDFDQTRILLLYASSNNFTNATLPVMYSSIQKFDVRNNPLMTFNPSGLSAYTSLKEVKASGCALTGTLPSVGSATTHYELGNIIGLGITGNTPVMSVATRLQYCYIQNCGIDGAIIDLSPCAALLDFYAYDNNLTSYSGVSIPSKVTRFSVSNNALNQNAVDEILLQMVDSVESVSGYEYRDTTTTTSAYVVGDIVLDITNGKWYQCKLNSLNGTLLTNTTYWTYKGKVRTGTLSLEGGTNATPSAAGLANASQLTAYGWTVTTN